AAGYLPGQLGWCDPQVTRVGEQRAANERFSVLKHRQTWITGIQLRVNSDDLKVMRFQLAYPSPNGRIGRLWDVDGNGRSEVSYSVPEGHAVVGLGVRCNHDDARHMVVYYRRFDNRGLTGPVRYAVIQHDRSNGQCIVVQEGFDRPTGFPIELTVRDPNRLLVGLGMRVNSDDFKHIEATFARPVVY
ncbi:MAG: hypothetical protein KF805_13050, partial [Phycisphaeraceae bacterium]|nr:hypothetical protein [Phycisphaeraceae bacterium]